MHHELATTANLATSTTANLATHMHHELATQRVSLHPPQGTSLHTCANQIELAIHRFPHENDCVFQYMDGGGAAPKLTLFWGAAPKLAL